MKAEFRMCLKHNRTEEIMYSSVIPNLEKKNHFQLREIGFENRCMKVISKCIGHGHQGDLTADTGTGMGGRMVF